MAKYSDIKGFTVQTVSSDPVASQAEGGSWASGGSLSTARTSAQSSGSGNDNAILAGGYLAGASPTSQSACESYNGTAWTEVSEMNTARQFGQGLGTNTAAIIVGGPPSTSAVEQWNGSSWTEKSEVNTGRILGAALGTTTAGLYAGGGPPPGGQTNVESWNGSSWTETSYDLNTGKYYMWGTGISTNAIVSGTPTTTEEFDGSSWTETTESSTDHRSGASAGIKTDALVYCGDNGPGYVAKTELWNGSSWTELNDLSQSKAYTGGTENAPSGTASALSYGGSTPTQTTSTEEWDAPSTFTKQVEGQLFFNSTANAFKETITDFAGAAWASAPSLNTARYNAAGNGLQTAGLVFGGDVPPSTGATEEFNGSAWTEKNDLNTSRARFGGSGTVTAGIGFGGDEPPATADTERWDGSSWTEVGNMNTARGEVAGGGGPAGYTAAIGATGRPSGNNATEIWDGSSWTEVNDTNTGSSVRRRLFGTTTAAIICGGGDTGTQTTVGANTESWDGTSWTEVNNLNTGRFEGGVCGIQTAGLMFGGSVTPSPGKQAVTEQWNGTSWTERADLGTAMTGNTAANSSPNAATFSAGGGTPVVATAEIWTADLANKTITAS